MKLSLILLFMGGLLMSCNQESPKPPTINGVWQSIGSGWVLQIQDSSQYAFYDITATSCLPERTAGLEEIIESLAVNQDTLSFAKGVMAYKFSRLDKLPVICVTGPTEQSKQDPLYNFTVFGETVSEHYAFMEINGINWPELYTHQKNKLVANPSEANLYRLMEETLDSLNDNHAYLEATEEVYAAVAELFPEEEEDSTEEELVEYGDFIIADMVAKHHFQEDLTEDSWLMKWGRLTEELGYIQVKAMWLYAKLEIPESLIEEVGYVDAYVKTFLEMDEGTYIAQEAAGARALMDQVMADLANTEGMVIDLRFNGGGQDAVSFEILRRFNPRKQKIITAKWKHKDGFSPVHSIYLEAGNNVYTKPVYLLVSPQTGSAAEALAIASLALDHTKRIGAPSYGATSTALEKALPNGWSFSISNEVYMDTEGVNYENVGAPVDYDLAYPTDRQTFFRMVANDLAADKRNILAAIEALSGQ